MPANRLAAESSPYLLQHAGNPVDWYPWGEEALSRARREGRMIFLSVGYSACHWCHVMAHESFEDEAVARELNRSFVSIKVDREERPDIDDVYQRACQAATGQGGWPLSAFLTPDQRPAYVGTYFPPMDSHGRPGFGSLVRRLAQAWAEDRAGVEAAAARFLEGLGRAAPAPARGEPGRAALDEAAMGLLQAGDATYGGFGGAPKFPAASCLSFMMGYASAFGQPRVGGFALSTLRRMARGGIFDHVGGGFHRYSTDAAWRVPHFEKMLYDNAQMASACAEAYQYSGDAAHLAAARATLDYVLRELRLPGGGFASAQDADSDGEEGAYYAWTRAGVERALGGGPAAEAFCLLYEVTDGGNWEGRTVLRRALDHSTVAFKLGMGEGEVRRADEEGRAALLAERGRRRAPGLDGKAVASWNALAVSALARAHRASGEAAYLEAAESCARFLAGPASPGGSLRHTLKDGRPGMPAYLEDHACVAAALLDLFEVLPEPWLLDGALAAAREAVGGFWDAGGSRFRMTSGAHGELVLSPGGVHDLSVPSGNSAAAAALLRLDRVSPDPALRGPAAAAVAAQARAAAENPLAYGDMLRAMLHEASGPPEVVVLGDGPMAASLARRHLPGAVAVHVRTRGQLDALSGLPLFEGKRFPEREAAYVCRGSSCSPPAGSPAELDALLAPRRPG